MVGLFSFVVIESASKMLAHGGVDTTLNERDAFSKRIVRRGWYHMLCQTKVLLVPFVLILLEDAENNITADPPCGSFSCSRTICAMTVHESIALTDCDFSRVSRVLLVSPRRQDAVVGGSFDEETCRLQAHGAGQLQEGKPRVHCSGGGGVEHVSGDGLTAAPLLLVFVSACLFDRMLPCNKMHAAVAGVTRAILNVCAIEHHHI